MIKRVFSLVMCFVFMAIFILPSASIDAQAAMNTFTATYALKRVYTNFYNGVNGVVFDVDKRINDDPTIKAGYYASFDIDILGEGNPKFEFNKDEQQQFGNFVYNPNDPKAPSKIETVPGANKLTIKAENLRYTGASNALIFNIKKDDGTTEAVTLPINECYSKVLKPELPEVDVTDRDAIEIQTPYVVINNYGIGGKEAIAGKDFLLTLQFKNTGIHSDIVNMIVTVEPSEQVSIASSSNTIHVPIIGTDETVSKAIMMTVNPNVSSKNVKVNVKMNYEYIGNAARKTVDRTETITIPVAQSGNYDQVPYAIVESYSVGDEGAVAGKSFPLELKIRNTSSSSAINNMMLTIDTPETMVLTNSSNTVHIPVIPPNGIVSRKIDISVKADATPESQKINLKMNYQYVDDNKRENMDRTETITVPVSQTDRFELTSVEIPETNMVGEEILVTVNYVNKGRSQIYNLSTEIEGNFANPGQKQNLGNLASGATGSTDFYVKSNEAGVLAGEIAMVYEDTNGIEHEQRISFSTNIEERFMPDMNFPMPDMERPMMPEKKSKTPIFIGVGVAVVAVIVTVIVVKKIRKKRREEEDADL